MLPPDIVRKLQPARLQSKDYEKLKKAAILRAHTKNRNQRCTTTWYDLSVWQDTHLYIQSSLYYYTVALVLVRILFDISLFKPVIASQHDLKQIDLEKMANDTLLYFNKKRLHKFSKWHEVSTVVSEVRICQGEQTTAHPVFALLTRTRNQKLAGLIYKLAECAKLCMPWCR